MRFVVGETVRFNEAGMDHFELWSSDFRITCPYGEVVYSVIRRDHETEINREFYELQFKVTEIEHPEDGEFRTSMTVNVNQITKIDQVRDA